MDDLSGELWVMAYGKFAQQFVSDLNLNYHKLSPTQRTTQGSPTLSSPA
jgi:hypothetical protein